MGRATGLRRLLPPAAAVALVACSWSAAADPASVVRSGQVEQVEQVDTVNRTVTIGSDTDVSGWPPTWEEATLREARRLHPDLGGMHVRRTELEGVGERMVVEADGFCALYGGLTVKGRWQANEIGPC